MLADHGLIAQSWPDRSQMWERTNIGQIEPSLVESSQVCPTPCQIWPNTGQIRPESRKSCPDRSHMWPDDSSETCLIRTDFGRNIQTSAKSVLGQNTDKSQNWPVLIARHAVPYTILCTTTALMLLRSVHSLLCGMPVVTMPSETKRSPDAHNIHLMTDAICSESIFRNIAFPNHGRHCWDPKTHVRNLANNEYDLASLKASPK